MARGGARRAVVERVRVSQRVVDGQVLVELSRLVARHPRRVRRLRVLQLHVPRILHARTHALAQRQVEGDVVDVAEEEDGDGRDGWM